MEKTKRKYTAECIEFKKRLKQPIHNVLKLMPIGFSDNAFCREFVRCYEFLWQDIVRKYVSYQDMDRRRIRKGLSKVYSFPKPEIFLCWAAYHHLIKVRKQHEKGIILSSAEQNLLRTELMAASEKKMAERHVKQEKNLRYVQKTMPKYTNILIEEYFRYKHRTPTDVMSRYIILQEAARYQSKKTMELLHKVNASERNYHLRYFAFQALQQLGETVRLHKNRKGKKRPGDIEEFEKVDTPDKLLNLIYNSEMEQNKFYDVFVSHSYKDSAKLLDLKAMLNGDNLNVYLDWVCDRGALKRELTNANTAQVIAERLKKSSALLYVYTEFSVHSQWTPWELGYFYALGKPIYVLIDMDKDMDIPEYLDLHGRVKIENGMVVSEKNGEPLSSMIEHDKNKNKKNETENF